MSLTGAQVGWIGRWGGAIAPRAAEAAGNVDGPTPAARAEDRCAEGPIDILTGREEWIGGTAPDVQNALAPVDCRPDQVLTGGKVAPFEQMSIPVQDLDRIGLVRVHGDADQRCRVGRWDAGQDHVDQPYEQLGIAGRTGDYLRQSDEHINTGPRVAELDSLQVLGTEGLLFDRRSGIERDGGAYIDNGSIAVGCACGGVDNVESQAETVRTCYRR